MSRLINLYTNDGRVIVGRSNGSFPVSVNVGYALVGPYISGYTPLPKAGIVGYIYNATGGFLDATRFKTSIYNPNYTPVYGFSTQPYYGSFAYRQPSPYTVFL